VLLAPVQDRADNTTRFVLCATPTLEVA